MILGIQFLTSSFKLKLVVKMNGRSITIVLGIICVILAASLVGAITNYTLLINEKDDTIASLETQIAALNNQLQQLETWLDGNKTLLSQTRAWLQGNITYYNLK